MEMRGLQGVGRNRRQLAACSTAAILVLAASIWAALPVQGAEAHTSRVELVQDINPFTRSFPTDLTELGGTLFFFADDGVYGRELWRSDGTAAGTEMVEDIVPADLDGHGYPRRLTRAGDLLFFVVDDGIHGAELWRSDGTAAGTSLVMDLVPGPATVNIRELANVGGTLFFSVEQTVRRHELWRSDGTEAGTKLVKPITGGSTDELTAVGSTLFFKRRDFGADTELWRSDGTPAGTGLVKDIVPGDLGSFPTELTDVGGTLFFFIANGHTNGGYGTQLWRSDGTEAGTELVRDLPRPPLSEFTAVGNQLFFFSGHSLYSWSGTAPPDLWRSDGTAAGTTLVKEIPIDLPWVGDCLPQTFATLAYRGRYFLTYMPEVRSVARVGGLWSSDGTPAGTQMLKGLGDNPNCQSIGHEAFPYDQRHGLAGMGNAVFFAGTDERGRELWRTDGTALGTNLFLDVNPGPGDSNPAELTNVNRDLFFVADDGIHGAELWRLHLHGCPQRVRSVAALRLGRGTQQGRLPVCGKRVW